MAKTRFGRGQKAMALVPLAVLSAAWTASIATAGTGTTLADASTAAASAPTTLPDGSSIPAQAIKAPASVSVAGGVAPAVHGSRARVVSTASTSGIPAAALAAYQRAQTVIDAADKTCHLTWQLVAAIGRVESDHGRTDGNTLDSKGVAHPGIFGPELNGQRGTTRIRDTDAGQYDRDTRFDRAIGPMQFIPSTWSVVGVDADGDGQRNPQDINDAALATAVYLCSGNDDLSTTAGQRAAVFRYNHSRSYVDLVLSIAKAYADGDFTSVPNGTTSAGYVVPAPGAPHAATHQGGHATSPAASHGSSQGSSGGSTPTHTSPPPAQPSPQPTTPAVPTPTTGAGGGGGGGGGGGAPHVPTPTLPPLPSTSVGPVDQVLSLAQAILQCTKEGYIDNPLNPNDAFDKCVYGYTH
jgi:membrane-bound lytic murein transglycosylase B